VSQCNPGAASTLLCLALLSTLLVNCGYHTNAQATQLPTDLHTIAVPAFVNKTQTYRIEQILTAAVVRELISRTHYHVVNEADSSADATLRGTVLLTQLSPVTFDSRTGRAATVLVTVNVGVSLSDRNGKVLFANPGYLFREQYQISSEPSSFFEEESPALDRLSRELARSLVSDMVEAY
jgi:outer membrane lipopolysaccharide assembly protein LptE/RlpB